MGEHSPKSRGEAVGNRFEAGRLRGGGNPCRKGLLEVSKAGSKNHRRIRPEFYPTRG